MSATPHPPTLSRRIRVPLALLFVLACVAATSPLAGQQTDRERADAATKRTTERLRALQREADTLAAQERTLLADLRKLEIERQIAVESLARIERDLKDTGVQIDAAEIRAATLAKAAAEQLPDVEARLIQLYKMGRAGYWRLLLNIDDLQALGRAYRTASAMTTIDRARIAEHYATLDALARERKNLHARAAELEGLKTEAAKARTALDRAVRSRTTLVEAIDQRRDLNAQLIGELQGAQVKLQAAITQMDAGRDVGILPLRPFQGDLPWPASGRMLRRFGRQPSSRFGTSIMRNGVELDVTEGQPVRSIHEGTVAYADQFAGYGNLVILDHGNGAYSLYGFLGAMDVSRGARVEAGRVLGTSGRDPSGNPALYFELRVDGTAVDPLQWLRKQP